MRLFLEKRWILFLVLIVFVACKIPHLYYPYYWDESWSYAPAVAEMYKHGISLLPNAMSAGMSRGHPLFFHACAAAWMNIFGTSLVATHAFALFISVLLLVAIYEAGLRLFNQGTATLALLLIPTQVFFFVQSAFLLVEVLVALLALLGFCFYVKDKYWQTALCLTMLFYTKESGLVAGVILGADAFIRLFAGGSNVKERLLRLLSVVVPCLLIGVFFLLQKHMSGWYVFPEHTQLVDFGWKAFWYKFRMACVRDAFYMDLRFYYFIVVLLLAIAAAAKNRNAKYLSIFLPAAIIYYFVDDMRAGRLLPPVPFFILFVLSVCWFLYSYSRPSFYEHAYQQRFIVLTGLFILCFLCFSTLNFYTYRYLQAAIIPLLFLVAVFTDMLLSRSYKVLYYPVIVIFLFISFCSFRLDEGFGDVDLGAFDAMDVQQKEVDYVLNHYDTNKVIGCGSFLTLQHLVNPATGFLHGHSPLDKQRVKWVIDAQTQIVLFDNVEPDKRYDTIRSDAAYQLVYRYQKGKVWTEIYERK